MLVLISLGLYDEKDMSIRALEVARNCDMLFVEFYTSRTETSVDKLEKLVGKDVKELTRKDLEENLESILEAARTKKVGIFVGGDCLVSTTHTSLLLEANKRGIDLGIVHGSSIISAVAETGLHLQKFGPYLTIPFLEKTKGMLPVSVYETLASNKERGLHTLCLLDIVERCMNVKEALTILLDLEEHMKKDILNNDTSIIVCSRLGSPERQIAYRPIKDLMEERFESPAVLIVPGNLHFTEKEALSLFSTRKEDNGPK